MRLQERQRNRVGLHRPEVGLDGRSRVRTGQQLILGTCEDLQVTNPFPLRFSPGCTAFDDSAVLGI